MIFSLKILAMKLLTMLIIAPLGGWLLLRFVEKFEKDWKFGTRRRRWVIMCGVFIIMASIGGWLR